MIVDYVDFGDVLTFDTTCGTNKELRPLGAFVGFNHHKQMVIFDGALMYDETSNSFAWLFETFLKAHGGKRPQTVFTDQDAAMLNALQRVWPDTRHGLCIWYLNQNGIKHLGWRMKEGSTFLTDLKKFMFEYGEEVEFEREWKMLLEKYSLKDNEWLLRMYSWKKKWARCYMKYAFTLGIRSTQLSESLNSDLKDYLKCDFNITDFFKNFDRVVEQKHEKELEAEFKAHQRVPLVEFSDSPLLQQAAQRYTPPIFAPFQTHLQHALRMVFKMKGSGFGNPIQRKIRESNREFHSKSVQRVSRKRGIILKKIDKGIGLMTLRRSLTGPHSHGLCRAGSTRKLEAHDASEKHVGIPTALQAGAIRKVGSYFVEAPAHRWVVVGGCGSIA
ncbi:protein FAR1-RELATED SEQUENCE 5-like [Tripterygium wilfordii]|uniref:protein FAR1-RELATED SEQUENCE 5-like n=1 Tax=Tripterygium wilfordii TaxID=458696 RepID=UPI0018F86115|nr:protein FAR1-RELATED SEQUENCE 5-like [Tripterygium wilfordii]